MSGPTLRDLDNMRIERRNIVIAEWEARQRNRRLIEDGPNDQGEDDAPLPVRQSEEMMQVRPEFRPADWLPEKWGAR